MADLTLQEAANILGVPVDADRQAIDKASRQLIRKWHPDAWRNASEQEQRRAADEFMRISKAQRVMQHPEEAAPEEVDYPSWEPQQDQYAGGGYSSGYQSGYSGGYSQTQSSSASDSDWRSRPSRGTTRTKYNTAKSFEDTFGQVPDTMEQTLNDMHNKEVAKSYKRAADAIRLTSSAVATILVFLESLFMFLVMLGTADPSGITAGEGFLATIASLIPSGGAVPNASTYGSFCLVLLMKLATYDAFLSYYIVSKSAKVTSIMMFGAECSVLAVVGIALGSSVAIVRSVFGITMLVGLACFAIGMLLSFRDEA